MKKNIAIIILSIIILILIIALIFMWLKIKDKTIKDVVTEKIQILDGPGMVAEDLSTKVKFENNECLAVGYIATGKEKQMKERYFNNEDEYSYLTTVSTGSELCQFLVIPKKLDATIRVWKYNLSEEGELYFEELLTVAKGTPLLIKTEATEILPIVGIEYMCEDVSFTMPLQFSGMDGKLIFNENEDLIKNISIY